MFASQGPSSMHTLQPLVNQIRQVRLEDNPPPPPPVLRSRSLFTDSFFNKHLINVGTNGENTYFRISSVFILGVAGTGPHTGSDQKVPAPQYCPQPPDWEPIIFAKFCKNLDIRKKLFFFSSNFRQTENV